MNDILDFYNRFARQIVLSYIGWENQEKIRRGKVLIVGLGGIGSPLANILARMGVGYLRVIDRDIVSVTDLHRQFLYTPNDVGKAKVYVAKERLEHENPGLTVDPHPITVNIDDLNELIKDVDVIVDGLDSIRARYIINRVALVNRKPYVFSGAIEVYGNATTIIPYETPCLECFYGDLDDESLPRCGVVGVHPAITTIIASLAASEVINLLMGKEPRLKSKLLIFDLEEPSMQIVNINRNPKCEVCSKELSLDQLKSEFRIDIPIVESSCARDGSGIFILNPKRKMSLDPQKIYEVIKGLGYKGEILDNYSVRVYIEDNVDITLLHSGVGITRVSKPLEDVALFTKRIQDIYNKIISSYT